MMEYGYARVSAKDQNLTRQLDALEEAGVPKRMVFADQASGRDFDRPQYRRMLKRLKAGDTVFVKSIDRLGRCYEDILEEWRRITRVKGAHVVVLDMPLLDTRTKQNGITGSFIADITLQLLSYIAQVERESIRQRQAEGIAAAKARGVRFGRPRIVRPECYEQVRLEYQRGKSTQKEAAAKLGISASTFAKWLKEDVEEEEWI